MFGRWPAGSRCTTSSGRRCLLRNILRAWTLLGSPCCVIDEAGTAAKDRATIARLHEGAQVSAEPESRASLRTGVPREARTKGSSQHEPWYSNGVNCDSAGIRSKVKVCVG